MLSPQLFGTFKALPTWSKLAFFITFFSSFNVFSIPNSDVDRHSLNVQSNNPSGKVTLLVSLNTPPLTESFKELRTLSKNSLLNKNLSQTKKLMALKKSFDKEKEVLIFQQDKLLSQFSTMNIPFKLVRRFNLLTNTIAVKVSADKIEDIRQFKEVKSVQLQQTIKIHLASSVPLVRAPESWATKDSNGVFLKGQGIRVAVIDTGVDYMHPDLGGGFGPGFKVVGGWDFANNDADPMDDIFHGTHVAGIVAANGQVVGVAPEASILAYKVFASNGDAFDADIIAALELAADPDGDPLTDDGADVINMSLGGPGDENSVLSLASDAAMQAGIVVVVSAGNDSNLFSLGAPASAASIITVGATDNNKTIASFSSGGPVVGLNIIKPEINAPGVDINSTLLNGGYGPLSGTSMSSPHVAGAAALLIQRYPQLSSKQIKELLISSQQNLPGNIYRDGAGFLDIYAAIIKQVIISPPLINLGEVDRLTQNWQTNSSFTLQNLSSETKSFQLSTDALSVLGVQLSFISSNNITINPGDSATIN